MKIVGCITVEELNARKGGNTFEGDVLVVYKVKKTQEVLWADLTDDSNNECQ